MTLSSIEFKAITQLCSLGQHLRFYSALALTFLFTGCASTQPSQSKWYEHLPENFADKTLAELIPELNTSGKQRFETCREMKEQVAGYCFMYAYQTTDTANNDQVFPYEYSFWDYMRAIDAGKYIPIIQGYEREYINKKRLDDLMSKAKPPSSNKRGNPSNEAPKQRTEGLIPRSSKGTYHVEEGVKTERGGVIEAQKSQVILVFPGE
ncbi:hypothetical protein [Vibrio celticus]|uniref:Uncharacterized protein n=1 Tax=Vibrio celticus TaxID=446372 RepID=A0A1C3JKZ0_9VIBR|nr:hypothetical protein [Vibrio celticus]SBT15782.1 hypothetical protein VCE7224_04593 [Vibrio celticus]